ncbi:MAG: hypothetical protein MK110_09155 [Fuerstiella sp.]|nr:hypothetical protein [Fuerstiella sp.]
MDAGGPGLSTARICYLLAAAKIADTTGQLISGQVSGQLDPRKVLATGVLRTALLNVLFGFGTALFFLIFICQWMGIQLL